LRAFLDFEASSLAKASYPIEVAWVFEDGLSESYLLKPLPEWTDWSERAQAIHGITRATLEAEGHPVAAVASRALEVLGGHDLYASSPSWDGKWLSVLLRAGGLPRHALRLKDTDEVQLDAALAALASKVAPEALEATAKAIVAKVRAAAESRPIAHRALADAEQERRIWLEITDEALRAVEAQRDAASGNGRPRGSTGSP